MARVNTYLNFLGNTEEAFTYYEKVFGTKITSISRMSDFPSNGGAELSAEDANKVMNVQLPILDGHVLMGTDMLESTKVGPFHLRRREDLNLRRALTPLPH